jgi:hypothetical protein
MGVGGQRQSPAVLPPWKTRYLLCRRLGGLQGRSERVRKISPPPGFNPQTLQPVASRYTDWAIPALLSVGHVKILVYSASTESEETLHRRIFYACQTIHNPSGTFERGATVHHRMCPYLHLYRGRTFWAFVANCDLINNKNSTVMKLGTCILNVFGQL